MTSGSPAGARRRLGLALRQLRDDNGITGDEAARAVDRTASWISRIESGQSGLRARELRDLLDFYNVHDDGRRAELDALAEAGRQRAWWSSYSSNLPPIFLRYIGLEADAVEIFIYQKALIPGLLQTPEYMHNIIASILPTPKSEDLEARVAVRLQRQNLLSEQGGPKFTAVIDREVLRHSYGEIGILRDQLRRILDLAERQATEIRILDPGSVTQIHAQFGFTLLRFADGEPSVAYIETLGGGLIEETPAVVAAYERITDKLLKASLDSQKSLALIRRAHKEI